MSEWHRHRLAGISDKVDDDDGVLALVPIFTMTTMPAAWDLHLVEIAG